jgi:hypothetical protein
MFNKNDEGFAERQVKTLQTEVWVDKDGKVESVNQSGHLGTKPMTQSATDPKVFECIGAYGRPTSKIPVTLTLESLGTIGTTPKLGEGVHEVKVDVKFNALEWLDEPEKVAALSDKERVELSNIGVIALNDKVIAAILSHKWSAMADAAQAIMQHASGTQEAFPKPIVTQEPDMVQVADHADGVKATLKVGEHTLSVGDKYWRFCSYGICKGRTRYALTWMDVPVSYLDEPK